MIHDDILIGVAFKRAPLPQEKIKKVKKKKSLKMGSDRRSYGKLNGLFTRSMSFQGIWVIFLIY